MRNYPTQIEYLASLNVFDKGEDAILAAKKEYRRLYDAENKRRQRQNRKEVQVLFSSEEFAKVNASAKSHKRTVARMVHDAALAYLDQVFIVPDATIIASTERYLGRIHQDLRIIKERIGKGTGQERMDFLNLARMVSEMEGYITDKLRTPPNLLALIKREIAESPAFKEQLRPLLL